MNEPLGWLCMDRSSPLGRSLIVQARSSSSSHAALTEAIHVELLWEHPLLDIPRKPRLDPLSLR